MAFSTREIESPDPVTRVAAVEPADVGWKLADKSGTTYQFVASGRLTRITDAASRSIVLTYNTTDGKLAKAQVSNSQTNTAGRALQFIWSGTHVAEVRTDAVNGLIGDWHGLVYYGALLLYGAFLFGSPEVMAALNRQRWLSLAIGVAAYATLYVLFIDGAVRPVIADAARPAYALVSAVNTMAWLFAIVGFANRHLTQRPAFLSEATEAVYPFYILHQTVTVIAVYWLLQIGAPPAAGFILAVLATFMATSAIYFGLVRPLWFLRPLFGLKAAYSTKVRPSPVLVSRSRTMNFSSER